MAQASSLRSFNLGFVFDLNNMDSYVVTTPAPHSAYYIVGYPIQKSQFTHGNLLYLL